MASPIAAIRAINMHLSKLQRLSKRAFSNAATQRWMKSELSPTITRLDTASLDETQFSNRKSYRGPLKAAILDWAGTAVDAHGMSLYNKNKANILC